MPAMPSAATANERPRRERPGRNATESPPATDSAADTSKPIVWREAIGTPWLVRVVSYRLIDEAAGSKPPSIQEATAGNDDGGDRCQDTTRSRPRLERSEGVSNHHQKQGQTQRRS